MPTSSWRLVVVSSVVSFALLASSAWANLFMPLGQIVAKSDMAVAGRVSHVEDDVALFRQIRGQQSKVTARIVFFDEAEIWDRDGKAKAPLAVELPADSLGVGESANVVWLLQAREDGLWDFADGRASYLNVIESEHRAKNISNTPAWLDTLWLTPDLRERTKRHLAPTYREELLRLGDKPATSNGVPLSLLWALLDANFEKSSR